MLIIHTTKGHLSTQKIGFNLAKEILKTGFQKTAVVLALYGNLGAGKTTFLQGFAKGLGIKEKILSPTFVIMKRFPAPAKSAPKWKNFYHIDCYRLKNEKDILELGFDKIIKNPQNIIAIEWPERVKKKLPEDLIKIKINFGKENTRKLTVRKMAHNKK